MKIPEILLLYCRSRTLLFDDPENISNIACRAMNFLTLSAGDAIFIPADCPHAYLSGDIVECMARSNNVLNTGFCPRADRDSIDIFTQTMTFAPHSADEVLLKPSPSSRGKSGKTEEYKPAMSEFNMMKTVLGREDKETIEAIDGPSILFVTTGSGKMTAESKSYEVKEGFVYFIGQGVETSYMANQQLVIYRAYAE